MVVQDAHVAHAAVAQKRQRTADEAHRGWLQADSRMVLATLDLFAALTAAIGAAFFVPGLSTDWFRFSQLPSPTLPAVLLGFLAALSVLAGYEVLKRGRLGALFSAVAGVALVFYELAESFAVGSLITPPVGIAGTDYVLPESSRNFFNATASL